MRKKLHLIVAIAALNHEKKFRGNFNFVSFVFIFFLVFCLGSCLSFYYHYYFIIINLLFYLYFFLKKNKIQQKMKQKKK